MGLMVLVVIGTSIWVLIDAERIGVKRGQVEGLADMGPVGWFICCLGIWIIAFPVYLAKREAFKRANARAAVSVSATAPAAGPVAFCTQCAMRVVAGDRFCGGCGSAVRN